MALAFGEKIVSKVYFGGKTVSAIYLGTNKVFPTEEEELPGTGDIRLRIKTTSANQTFQLFSEITTEEGGYISVDWGDGNKETFTGETSYWLKKHVYAKASEYIVKLTGSKFTEILGETFLYDKFQVAIREILSLKMPIDSTNVSLRYTFYGCSKLTGSIPAWDDRITDTRATYAGCTGLTGSAPKWGMNITNAYGTYEGCTGLTGNIPAWGANITKADGTYYHCTSLTGSIPEWGAKITSVGNTYNGCTGLTGNIPAWGANITNAPGTYYHCTSLTGSIPEWGAKITSVGSTYRGCTGLTGNIPAWGANITKADGTYYHCTSLTGSIPEWGAKITSVGNTYNGCTGLTGNIPAWGANITSVSNTYNGCTGLTGNIPAWGANITSVSNTYNGCTGLTGSIPEWGTKMIGAHQTYLGCSGLTGNIPAWGANIKKAYGTYEGCTGLTGNIPAWGSNITDADDTYTGCTGLTGSIPAWGAKITNAAFTYYGCTGLTSCSAELLQDPMPTRITGHDGCVSRCADAIRHHFTWDWGGEAPNEVSDWGDIRLRIETTKANQSFQLFYRITTEEGGYVTVDWGDGGNMETLTGKTTYQPTHTYAEAGEYVVILTGSKFTGVEGTNSSSYRAFQVAIREIFSLKMPANSTSVSLNSAFCGCTNLTGVIPAWDDCITDAGYTYYGCTGLIYCSLELLQDPMPSRITSHADCVTGCEDEIRKNFMLDWGGTGEELPGTGDIRLRIETTKANQSFQLFYQITTEEGGYVTVDWGDGNEEMLTGKTTYTPKHVYAEAGEYVVRLTGSKFTEVEGTGGSSYDDFRNALREILSLKMPTNSKSVSLFNTFVTCTSLTGNIPRWDDRITDTRATYAGCTGLTGSAPKWGMNITNAYGTYEGCTGLTGNIPAWGAKITNAALTYQGCTGLTGGIPAWGANITNAHRTYRYCTGLTGCSWGLLQDPMPSRITSHDNCVDGCADEIRQHFTRDWGGTKPG